MEAVTIADYSIKDLISRRRSVRTYDGTPLRAEDRQKLEAYAQSLQNPFGIPVTFRILDAKAQNLSSPVVLGADTYLGAKVAHISNAEIAFGYDFERFVLYAQSLGIGTVWLAATIDRPAFERAMEVMDGEVMPAVTPLGYPAAKKSVRESLMRKAIKADNRFSFETLFFQNTFQEPLSPENAGRFRDALEMVRLAPSVGNKQPWRIVICDGVIHFYEKKTMSPNALGDIQKVDIGIALAHFMLTMEESSADAVFFADDPGVIRDMDTEYIISCRV